MFPFYNFASALNLFVNVVQYFIWKRSRTNDVEDDIDVLLMTSMSNRIYLQFLTLLPNILKIISINVNKRRRNLV